MNKKKIIISIGVIILVIVVCILFVTVFAFDKKEPESTELPEVTEELVNQLYSYIPTNEMNQQTMYSFTYTRFNNITNSVALITVYEYILEHDEFKLETTSITDMQTNGVLHSNENESNITPLYKIKAEEFTNAFKKIFGKEASLTLEDFRYNYNTLLRLNSNKDYYFVLNNNPLDNPNNDIVFHDITKYVVTENNKTIEIYDYYLKCDLNTNNCYNDERKNTLNAFVKYNDSFSIDNYQTNLANYKHTFKYEDGYYYWYSSEIV